MSLGTGFSGARHALEEAGSAECSAASGAPPGLYCYAGAGQAYSGTGAVGYFGIHAPAVALGDFHSLAEVSVSCCQSATLPNQQVVEAGWIVDPQQFGDSGTHLFVNAWVNGKFLGYNTNFTMSQSAMNRPGDLLATTAKPTPFAIRLMHGNWWVLFNNSWLGYFDGSLWSSRFLSSDSEQWFGEVAASNPLPSTTMGNGIPGTQAGSAQVSNMELFDPTGALQIAAASVNSVTNPSLYSVGGQSGATFSSFRYGGQGDPPTKIIVSSDALYVTSAKPGATATVLSKTILAALPT